ncbi:MAG TPA: 16S rRNA (cytosine(1402)-N(4))-methyltransferase RsmH [Actinomycetota bacterium]|nr:16S rRNA (cytosine(1402)-N(4))-methyltransferase RsmH [Actinomycetota bacterium]
MDLGHRPVLADRVVELLLPALEHGGVCVDATLGRGGHAALILAAAPRCELVGIDRDPVALAATKPRLAPFGGRVRLARDDFSNLASVLERLGIASIRGVLLDLGVSSPQLDDPDRGFSFRHPGPLDMRMDPSQSLSADTVVNAYAQKDLERVIRRNGEERFATRIAKAIVAHRPIGDTATLADTVKDAIPAPARRTGPHPARRTFQGIRMEVNQELEALTRVLPQCVDALEPGGRMVVLSYHSLEDRIVKRYFTQEANGCTCPPDLPVCVCGAEARVRVLTRRPLRASEDEIEANPRASAGKLRAAERIAADDKVRA